MNSPTRPLTGNPLADIERNVQERAARAALDVATTEDRHRLAQLVAAEVAEWSADFARGRRPFDLAEPTRLADRAMRNLVGLGPLEPLLADDDVWEIMINGPAAVFVKRHHGPDGYAEETFHDDDHLWRTLTKIFDEAVGSHRKLDPAEGLQDAQLATGARLHVVHGDIGQGGHLLVNIRKTARSRFSSLAELVACDMLDERAATFLRAAMATRMTVIFAGSPGSGKTTLMRCCAAELDPALRVVVAEEVFEADLTLPNVAAMQTRPARPDRPAVDLRRLVAGFLRMAPDVAIVGEVRDREALPLLMTLSSGVKGMTTIHAGSARQGLSRLRLLCQLAETADTVPMAALNTLVSESVDLVVHTTRTSMGPQVSEIVAVEDNQSGPDSTAFTVTDLFGRRDTNSALRWSGHMPRRVARQMALAGADVRRLLGADDFALTDAACSHRRAAEIDDRAGRWAGVR